MCCTDHSSSLTLQPFTQPPGRQAPCIRMTGMGDIFVFVDTRLQMIIIWKVTTYQNDRQDVPVDSRYLQFGQFFCYFLPKFALKEKILKCCRFWLFRARAKKYDFSGFSYSSPFLATFLSISINKCFLKMQNKYALESRNIVE